MYGLLRGVGIMDCIRAIFECQPSNFLAKSANLRESRITRYRLFPLFILPWCFVSGSLGAKNPAALQEAPRVSSPESKWLRFGAAREIPIRFTSDSESENRFQGFRRDGRLRPLSIASAVLTKTGDRIWCAGTADRGRDSLRYRRATPAGFGRNGCLRRPGRNRRRKTVSLSLPAVSFFFKRSFFANPKT